MTKLTQKTKDDMTKLYEFVKQNQPVKYQVVYDTMGWSYARLCNIKRQLYKEKKHIQSMGPYSVWYLPAEMTPEQTHQYCVLKANTRSMNQWYEIIEVMTGKSRYEGRYQPKTSEEKEKRLFEQRSEFVQRVHDVSWLIEDEVFEPHDDLNETIKRRLDSLVHQTYRTEIDWLKLVMSRLYFTWMQYEFGEINPEDVARTISAMRHELVEISLKYKLKVDIIG